LRDADGETDNKDGYGEKLAQAFDQVEPSAARESLLRVTRVSRCNAPGATEADNGDVKNEV
jgi:hypothetical protein